MSKRANVEATAAEVEHHPAAAWAASAGQVVNGVVHIIIGLIAVGIARGAGGSADQSGALRAIDATPLGSVGLWVAGIAMYALAVHSFAVAIGEMRHSKKDALRAAGRGVAHLVVATMAVVYATGGTSGGGEEAAKSVSAQLMATTWGSWLLAIGGVVVLAVGIGHIVSGIRQTFLKDVEVSGTARRVFTVLGATGYVAKGVAIGIVGILFVVAVVTRDPDEAGGLDGALKKLTELPFGTVLLVVIGVGLITYGAYCFARARTTARKRRA